MISLKEFIELAIAGNGVEEEFIEATKTLDLFVQVNGVQGTVHIREFDELGIHSIEEEYCSDNFEAYTISNYLDAHPDHILWDYMYEDYLSNCEEE